MKIMNLMIKVNNFFVFAAFAIIILFTAISAMAGQIQAAIFFGVGGTVVCSMLFGFWAVFVSLLEESKKQTIILSKLVDNKETK